ncbi:unnamed protein product, partial [Prorocentrum cordatum]
MQRLEAAVALYNTLGRHSSSPAAVHAVLGALASVSLEPKVRCQLVSPDRPGTWKALDGIARVAEAAVDGDADVLAQACLAVGALTAAEAVETRKKMREEVDWEPLVRRVHAVYPQSAATVSEHYCDLLVKRAARSDLRPWRLLTETGE